MLLIQQIYTLIFLLVLSAFFSASETAIISISRLRVLHLIEKKKKGAETLMRLKEDPHKTLSAILIGNNLVNVSATVLAASISLQLFKNLSLGVTTGVMTFIVLFFGEITPKSVATAYKDQIALVVAKPIRWLTFFLFPIIWFFDIFAGLITKRAPKRPLITEDEIKTIIRVGEEEGAIDKNEMKMLQRIFRFDDVNVVEVMTHRPDVVMVKSEATLRELAEVVSKHSFSRIPVYDKNKDNVVGVVFTKDILKYPDFDKKVSEIMRPIHFVPETQKLDTLLGQFKKRGESIAIVVDEYGDLVGLITMEDILEEIVGEIVTEKDKMKPCIVESEKNCWVVEGKTDVEEVNEKLKSKFKEGTDFETIGGYVINKLQKIPEEGDKIEEEKYNITVEKLEGNRIKEIKIEKK